MFNRMLTLDEMDRLIFNEEREKAISLIELVKILSESDLKIYLDTFKSEKNVQESDLAFIEKVGPNAFYLASELQFRG